MFFIADGDFECGEADAEVWLVEGAVGDAGFFGDELALGGLADGVGAEVEGHVCFLIDGPEDGVEHEHFVVDQVDVDFG